MTEQDNNNNDGNVPGPPVPPPAEAPAPPAAPAPGDPAARPVRRGLPGWAWAVIAGGVALFIVVIIVVVLAAGALLGAVGRAGQAGGQPAAPAVTAPPDASSTQESTTPTEPTESPDGDQPAAGTRIPLDELADLGPSFPVWNYPILDGWEITTFDQNGLNTSQSDELGCVFTSSQNKQPAQDMAATNDMTDTLATFEVLETRALEGKPEAELVGELDTADFAVAYPGGEGSLEFITSRIDYLDPDRNVDYTLELAGRAMPLSESFMYIEVFCPTALVDAGQSPFEELRGGLEVTTEGSRPE